MSKRKSTGVLLTQNESKLGRRNLLSISSPSDLISSEAYAWTCFICSRRLPSKNELFLSHHIDECLNKKNACAKVELEKFENVYVCSGVIADYFPSSMRLESISHLIGGLWIIRDFITEEEHRCILNAIDKDDSVNWKHSSFNGHTDSKVFGVRTQFGLPKEERLVRQNDESANELGIPSYLNLLMERVRAIGFKYTELSDLLRDFKANECNINSYERSKGHYLTPHYDDRALSGPLLLNVSFCCPAVMTYTKGTESVRIDLPMRCLQIVSEESRYQWKHSIKAEDINGDRRVSVTFRQAGGLKGVVRKAGQLRIDAAFG